MTLDGVATILLEWWVPEAIALLQVVTAAIHLSVFGWGHSHTTVVLALTVFTVLAVVAVRLEGHLGDRSAVGGGSR